MSEFEIEAQTREITGKHVKYLRRAGQVPGIVYGPKTEPVSITLDARELAVLLSEAGGTSIVDIKVGKDTHQTLVRDVQRDILRGDPIHVDFYAVDLEQVTQVEVPVVLVGESPIVASRTGIAIQGVTSVEVEGLPMDLISEITVDMEDLTEIGMLVTVGDLYVPSKLTILTDPTDLVVKIDYPTQEEEEEEEPEEELLFAESAEPEVIGRGAEEEEMEEEGEE